MGIVKPFASCERSHYASNQDLPTIHGATIRKQAEFLGAIDPDLKYEEESYIRHYLNYADVLLNRAAEKTFHGDRLLLIKPEKKR